MAKFGAGCVEFLYQYPSTFAPRNLFQENIRKIAKQDVRNLHDEAFGLCYVMLRIKMPDIISTCQGQNKYCRSFLSGHNQHIWEDMNASI